VLLARVERKHESPAAFVVSRLADQPSGHIPDVLHLSREKSHVRPAERHGQAE